MLADRYELRALLGKGGMAEVHEATAHGAHGFVRRVAIKRLLPETAGDPVVVRMFLDEARIASRLHHAGIVAVLDYAVADDLAFQVLELVDGWDVAALMRQVSQRGQTVPVDVALFIATEIAHALTYAHEARDERGDSLGIVHRDVKPSNILVSRTGDVKLGDFGIALARERASKTTGFVARGTPGYMSPEQLMGSAVDARTDVFALGCTLHAMVAGWSPLTDESARAAFRTGAKLPMAPALPPGIFAIVERAVAVAPDGRFSSAREMALALGVELSGLLRADPKSRMMQWLDLLAVPPPIPSSTMTSSVLTVASLAATRLASTLTSTDRIFVSEAPVLGNAPPAYVAPTHPSAPPAYVAPSHPSAPPAYVAPTHPSAPPAYVAPTHPSAPPAYVAPTYPSGPPARASFAPALPAQVAPQAHSLPAPRPDRRLLVFALALLVPIAIAVIAGIGVVAGHQLSKRGQADAGVVVSAAGDGAPVAPGEVAPSRADASAAVGTSAGKASAKTGTPSAAGASPPPLPAAGGASGLAGTGPPVKGGCICTATHELGTTGVCHPQLVRTPRCECKASRSSLCWVPFSKDGDDGCPETTRTMPATARDGQPCTGFAQRTTFSKDAAGKTVSHTSTGPAQPGELDTCDRCPGDFPAYPRTNGAPCVGIVSQTGARVQGKVDCF